MWFWFGLEILRLVYKKAFLKILNGFYLIWVFNLKKTASSLIRVDKIFLQNWAQRVSKEAEFSLISKMCRTLASRSSQRFFLRKRTFCKIQFFCKFFSLLPNTRLLHISKNAFLKTSLRISRPNQKHMKHIKFRKKFPNHWTLVCI
jgi:hypothetical protein